MTEQARRIEPANDRSHEHVLDLETGAWVSFLEYLGSGDYGDVITEKRVALRMGIEKGIVRYVCPWCKEAMIFSSVPTKDRSADRFFFKHLHDTGECSGSKGKSAKAICAQRFAQSKEGELHKRFKLRLIDSIDADPSFSQTNAETRWKDVGGVRWRQPDVQSVRGGERIAFEVQLSTTFLHVIAERMAFYERNQGRLLWLFRDLDPDQFRLAEDDIFFANNRNAFRVSKETVTLSQEQRQFMLECVWHEPVESGGAIADRQHREIIPFSDLTFDVSAGGVPRAFYFDYGAAKEKLQKQMADAKALARDEPLRRDFEAFYIGYLRKEIVYPERDQMWQELVGRFRQRGYGLPEYPDREEGPHYYLLAAYSAKLGTPVGMGHDNLVKLGHYLLDHRKQTIWIYRLMLEAHQRHEHMRKNDPKGRWVEKAKHYRQALIRGDGEFLPNRLLDPVLSFLFPEIADTLTRHPRDVLRT